MTQRPLRILVVDDDHNMAKTLADILRISGYEAERAHCGSEALDRLAEQPFDCVLSDIKMPGIDGVELNRAIRALRPDLPVVLMTAYSADSLVKEGLAAGALAAMTKPIDIGALLAFLARLQAGQSVVIVDDDPAFCRTLGGLLREHGFAATCITDPSGGLDALEAESGVMLLDMKLEGTDGLTLLRSVKEKHPRQAVILITGYRQEMAPRIAAALENGALTCLYKPLAIDPLLRILAETRRRELARILDSVADTRPRAARKKTIEAGEGRSAGQSEPVRGAVLTLTMPTEGCT